MKILSKLRYWLRGEVLKYLLILNNDKYSDINFTTLNAPIFRISNTYFYVFNMIMTTLIPNITMIFIVFLYFMYNNIYIGSIFLLGNIIILIYFTYVVNIIIYHNKIYENDITISESYMVEILNNIDKIIFRGNINEEIDKHNKKCDNTVNSSIKFYSISNYHGLFMTIIISITILIILYKLIQLFYSKQISMTLFITFLTILLLYRDLILSTIQQIPDMIEFLYRTENIMNIFNGMHDNHSDTIDKKYTEYNLDFNNIEFKNIKFKYKNSDNYILDNFNLNFNISDKIIGITGLSGNGKSTFAKLLIKVYKYDGEIYIDNINIQNIDPIYLRKNIIFVNQNSKLFDKKIIENILYGCNDIDKCNEHLKEIMKYKKISELFKNIDLYEKNAGLGGENLSGGQRQIINIINGLITPSNIIILDEPTNGLDKELKMDIINVIKYFKKYKKCIIIISHDHDIFQLFDETIKINK
jgi:ABC-type bacteriocin/lantibiotic exporter with double-glycine peptidase domain